MGEILTSTETKLLHFCIIWVFTSSSTIHKAQCISSHLLCSLSLYTVLYKYKFDFSHVRYAHIATSCQVFLNDIQIKCHLTTLKTSGWTLICAQVISSGHDITVVTIFVRSLAIWSPVVAHDFQMLLMSLWNVHISGITVLWEKAQPENNFIFLASWIIPWSVLNPF